MDWNIILAITSILSVIGAIYFKIENSLLKGFELDKTLTIIKLKYKSLKINQSQELHDFNNKAASTGMYRLGSFKIQKENLLTKHKVQRLELIQEYKYLQKLKRYRWIFTK